MTALTPAQVRDHARALIRWRATLGDMSIARFLLGADLVYSQEDFQDVHDAIYDAIRTARIEVKWDEEGT